MDSIRITGGIVTTLIAGGIGWVPSHFTRAIAATGEHVVTYDLMEPDAMFRELLGHLSTNVTTIPGDITDASHLRSVCEQFAVTSIIHAAAITPRRDREQREPARIIEVNLGGTVNALDVARQLPNFRRFIYISSGAAIGEVPGATAIDESTPSHATSLYGITKHTSERVVSRYRDLFGLDAVSVRLANVFGPMERVTPGYVGATELREMLRIHFDGEPVRVNSLAGPWLDWTYVGDIAEGIKRFWEAPTLNDDVYTNTCGQAFSIGNVLDAFARHLPGFRYEEVDRDQANYLVSGSGPGPVPSNTRMRDELGWTPPTSFDEGMRQYLTWIQQHGPQ
jgi:UDP-glucose 4-epimerase